MKNRKEVKAIFFDGHGTILDSDIAMGLKNPDNYFFQNLAQETRKSSGGLHKSFWSKFKELKETRDIDYVNYDKYYLDFGGKKNSFADLLNKAEISILKKSLYDDFIDVIPKINEFRENGIKIALCSMDLKKYCKIIMHRLEIKFDMIVGLDTPDLRKVPLNKAPLFSYAAKHLNVLLDKCLVIGDDYKKDINSRLRIY